VFTDKKRRHLFTISQPKFLIKGGGKTANGEIMNLFTDTSDKLPLIVSRMNSEDMSYVDNVTLVVRGFSGYFFDDNGTYLYITTMGGEVARIQLEGELAVTGSF
jgi:hypothetical protein